MLQHASFAASHLVMASGGFIEVSANTLGWIKVLAIAAGGVAAIVSVVATFILSRFNVYKTVGAAIGAFVVVFLIANFALGVTFAQNSYNDLHKKPPTQVVNGIGN